ncbi:MAG TPA: ATP synthase F0 subunit B [Syntrophales bacterium]|nr:ATP synthase F0 subunit B [Syntrophales bacterium]
MIKIDYTLWIQMVNFLALIFILNLLLYKPILGIIDKRKKQVQDTEDEIRRLNQMVEERMASYEEKLRLAKMDALEKKLEIIREGAEQAKSFIEAAKGEIPGMMEKFHEEIGKEISEARRILTDQSRGISIEITEKLLGRSLA